MGYERTGLGKMAKSNRELRIALLQIQAILLETDAGIYCDEYGNMTLEDANANDHVIKFENPNYD